MKSPFDNLSLWKSRETVVTSTLWLASVAGTFLNGMLSISILQLRRMPFFDASAACASMGLDPGTQLFGIPISHYGLGYFAIQDTLLSCLLLPGITPKRFIFRIGYGLSVAALVVNACLLSYSWLTLHFHCVFCLFAAAINCVVVMSYAVLADFQTFGLALRSRKLMQVGAVLLPALFPFAYEPLFQNSQSIAPLDMSALNNISLPDLLPNDAHVVGPVGAPNTVLVFADGQCPYCAKTFSYLFSVVNKRHDLRVVIRHFPLQSHPYSLDDAIGAELASQKGDFWRYEAAIYDSNRTDKAAEDILISLGWTRKQISKRLADNSDAQNIVMRDKKLGSALRIQGTPTIIEISGANRVAVSQAYLERRYR